MNQGRDYNWWLGFRSWPNAEFRHIEGRCWLVERHIGHPATGGGPVLLDLKHESNYLPVSGSGRSSGVEHNLAMVRVVSSNLIARSNSFVVAALAAGQPLRSVITMPILAFSCFRNSFLIPRPAVLMNNSEASIQGTARRHSSSRLKDPSLKDSVQPHESSCPEP